MRIGGFRGDLGLIRRVWPFVRPDWWTLAVALGATPVVVGLSLVQPWLLKRVIDEHLVPGEPEGLMRLGFLYLGAVLAGYVLEAGFGLAVAWGGQRMILRMRQSLYRHTLGFAQAYFDRQPAGRLLTRLTSDIEALGEAFTSGVVTIPLDLLMIVGVIGTMLMLDPGLAFGTGTHPTTALCLEWLDGQEVTGKQVTDYGCGSGILGLAALLLGAEHVIGVDTDPQALEASRDNARRPEVADQRLDLYLPGNDPDTRADIMLANILAQPLIGLAPRLAELTRPGGDLVLSGILFNQAREVMEAYEPWFIMDEPEQKEEWIRLTGRRKTG